MGWVWKDEDAHSDVANEFENANRRSSDRCATRKIIKSKCSTEEVEPGKFIRKCETTEQILKDYVGRPSEVVRSIKEIMEEDVSDQVNNPMESSEVASFYYPVLRSDIEAIESRFFGDLGHFFDTAEKMKNGFFSVQAVLTLSRDEEQ